MVKLKMFIYLSCCFCWSPLLNAAVSAPVPTAQLPFQLSMLNTNWYESPLPLEANHLAALYRSPAVHAGVQGTLSVRLDEPMMNNAHSEQEGVRAPAALDIRKYGQRWIADFPRSGFSVLKSEERQLNGDTAIVADLKDLQNGRQLRQMMRANGQKVAILTCSDHPAYFAQTVKACEVLFRTFRWLNEAQITSGGSSHSPFVE